MSYDQGRYETPDYALNAERKWASSFQSLLESSLERNIVKCTYFTDPRQQQMARDLLLSFPHATAFFLGGYLEAERVRICVCPASFPEIDDGGKISCLSLSGSFPPHVLSHRDFLGAILALGIKREMVGDILYRGGEKAIVFVVADMSVFVRQNLLQVGRYPLSVEEVEAKTLDQEMAARRVKEIKGTVASMRLDAVAGLGFGLSRSKIVTLIRGEQLKVNYQIVKQPSRTIKPKDILSLAGRGRLEVAETMGESRKGRIRILLMRIY